MTLTISSTTVELARPIAYLFHTNETWIVENESRMCMNILMTTTVHTSTDDVLKGPVVCINIRRKWKAWPGTDLDF